MAERQVWNVDHEVREDATSVFLAVDAIPGAAIGDRVSVASPGRHEQRIGRIVRIIDDAERGRFFSVDFE